MEKYNISGAIVVYNNAKDAFNTVKSVLSCTQGLDFSLFVIDNNSQEKIADKLKMQFETPQYITLEQNIGFGKGHNQVLGRLKSKYHFVINPDIIINPDTISAMCDFMDKNPQVAISCPKVLHPDGSLQYIAKNRPSFLALVARRVPIKVLKNFEDRYLAKEKDQDRQFEVDFCTGCFFVIRTEVFEKIKGFDPQYFLYFEDADITMEAKKYGSAYYNPSAQVVHYWHRETAKSIKPFFQQLASMFIYFKKWGFKL